MTDVKRLRAPKAKPGELIARWGKVEGIVDLCYDGPSRPDMHLLHGALTGKKFQPFDSTWSASFLQELEERGYDITTLKFSIKKKTT